MRMRAILVILALGAGSSLSAFASFDSIRADELIRAYHVDEKAFSAPGSNRETELDNPASKLSQVLSLLDTLETLEFSPALSPSAGFIREPYREFVMKYSTSITSSENSPCKGSNAIACHSRRKSPMWISDGFFDDTQASSLQKVAAIIHESRHGQGFDHFNCTRGPYAEQKLVGPYCDPSYDYGGAYATEVEFLARVALYGKSFHPTETALARREALLVLDQFINEPVRFDSDSLLVLKQKDTGQAFTYDGKKATPVEGLILPASSKSIFLDTTESGVAAIANSEKSALQVFNAKEGVSASSLLDADSSARYLSQEVRISLDEALKQTPAISFFSVRPYMIQLYPFALVLWKFSESAPGSIAEIPIDDGHFDPNLDAVSATQFTPSGKRGLYLVMKDKVSWLKQLLRIDLFTRENGTEAAQLRPDDESWPDTLLKIIEFQGRLYRLDTDGKISIQNSDGQWSELEELSAIHSTDLKVFDYSNKLHQLLDRSKDGPTSLSKRGTP